MDGDEAAGLFAQLHAPGPLWPGARYRAEQIGPPERWTQVFAGLHKERVRSDAAVRRNLLLALRSADDAVWHTLWARRFPAAVFRAAQEGHFCGGAREELMAVDTMKREQITAYVRWLLLVLYTCIHRIMTEYEGDPYPRQREAAVGILHEGHARLWTALWQVRVPFLHHSTANEVDKDLPEATSLYGCVIGCSTMADEIFRYNTGAPAHVVHLHVLAWIYTDDWTLRMRALEGIATGTSPDTHERLLPEVLEGPVTSEDILSAYCRDFSDPRVREGFLYYAYTTMIPLWPRRTRSVRQIPRLESKLERKAFGLCVAAYRRQLCFTTRGQSWRDRLTRGHLVFIGSALQCVVDFSTSYMPESQLYGIVGILAQWLIPAMEGKEEPWPSETDGLLPSLTQTLSTIGRLFGSYKPPRPALAPLRRHTYRAWKATIAALDARRGLRDLPEWREALVVWRRLGRFMPGDAREDVEEEPRGVFERCAWAECECHVHRPLHPVKVCKGCWLVAYCSERCQKSDWTRGGHHVVCRRGTGK